MSKVILDHKGLLSFSTIDTLLTKFKGVSEVHNISFRSYKRVLNVMIESLENICKYNDEFEAFVSTRKEFLPSIKIIMNSDAIHLRISNPVRAHDVEKIKESIDRVNSKDRLALREMYLNVMTDGKFSSNGGAGLGFIEMARTSGNKLDYQFEQITDDYAMYTIIVTILS